jgi:hypothetical protein
MESDGSWAAIAAGEGNWYARVGLCHQFLENARAEQFVNEFSRREDEDEE